MICNSTSAASYRRRYLQCLFNLLSILLILWHLMQRCLLYFLCFVVICNMCVKCLTVEWNRREKATWYIMLRRITTWLLFFSVDIIIIIFIDYNFTSAWLNTFINIIIITIRICTICFKYITQFTCQVLRWIVVLTIYVYTKGTSSLQILLHSWRNNRCTHQATITTVIIIINMAITISSHDIRTDVEWRLWLLISTLVALLYNFVCYILLCVHVI